MANICQVQWLGQVEYEAATKLQHRLVIKRIANEIPNMLLLLEHPPTYSVGLSSRKELLLTNRAELSRLNIAYHEADRGGSVMYHGPGQLVAHPILSLRECGYNYHSYIEALESVIIRALRAFEIQAFRQPGQRGVWVLPGLTPHYAPRWSEMDEPVAQIGIIGIRVNNNDITSYGFYINVEPDLKYFDLIVPRDLPGCNVTSLERVLRKPVKIGDVIQPVIQSFCEFFELEPLVMDPDFTPATDQALITSAREFV
jgi:lipoate-protein ligase B